MLVVDDASPDERASADARVLAGELRGAYVRNEANRGFAGTVNAGLAIARDEGLDALLVNADLEFPMRGWMEAMLARTDHEGRPAAVVGARLLYPTHLIQHGGIYFSALLRDWFHRFKFGPANLPEALEPSRCPVTGALQLIRHDTLRRVGLYDEDFGLAYEDVDYCLRVFAEGLECIYEPAAVALHLEKAFRGAPTPRIAALHDRSVLHFRAKYAGYDVTPWAPAVR
jgi:GT2 family glycosyltransferase